ncbi:ABC transporter ATP-binding protein [Roseovarius sp. MBR-79]
MTIENLSRSFGGVHAFRDLNFVVPKGEVLGVIGPNGAGKTTLVNVLSNQLRPSDGRVLLEGAVITGLSMAKTAQRSLVRSFQHTSVYPSATIIENLRRARLFAGKSAHIGPTEQSLLEDCGLSSFADRTAGSLPYGVQKMLGLVMVALTEPKVLLMDEPAAGLERKERVLIDKLIAYVRATHNCSVMIVEHDMDLIRRLCPRTLVLEGGRLLAEGATEQVLQRPEVISAYLGEALEAADA